jgi:hypothetical protein
VFVNFEFVDGTRGGPVSISGVSGIATKTSFATFLLHSIFNCGVLAGEAVDVGVRVHGRRAERTRHHTQGALRALGITITDLT